MTGTANIPLTYMHNGADFDTYVTANYRGGAYIDISFGQFQATEVINVWDYQTGKSTLTGKRGEIKEILTQWIKDQDDYEMSYQDEDMPLQRDWLRAYIENR